MRIPIFVAASDEDPTDCSDKCPFLEAEIDGNPACTLFDYVLHKERVRGSYYTKRCSRCLWLDKEEDDD